jgi:hypothetical protein
MEKNQARSRLKPKKESLLKKYLHYIFCLLIALFAYFLLYLLLSKVYPSQIQNFLFKNSYLPFLLLVFIANFFIFTFLSLNKRFGLIIAFLINFIIYFRISDINFDLISCLTILLIILVLFVLVFWEKIKKLIKK